MGIFDKFFGVDDARDDIRRGAQESSKALNIGAEAARGEFGSALDFFSPDIEAGDDARNNLLAAIGLRGREAQQGFFTAFNDDPGFKETLGAGIEAVDSSAAARGNLNSGGTQKDLFQFGQRAKFSQFQDRLDRLTGLSAVGSRARAGSAGVKSQVANFEFGLGQLRANARTGVNNALAETRGQGINNLIGAATGFAKAARGFT